MAELPPDSPSEDLIAINREAAIQLGHDSLRRRSIARDPDLATADELKEEIEFLETMLNGGWPAARLNKRLRALRILVRRFGRLGAQHMINLVADVSLLDLRIILRRREDEERYDGGQDRRRIERELQDARLLAAVHRHRTDGMTNEAAMFAAAEEVLGRVSGGIEGVRKAMTRARAKALQRRYVNPLDPFIAVSLGGYADEPKIKVADLRGPGRPKIPTKRR